MTVFLCFSETAEAFPLSPRLDANFSLFGIRFCAWFGLWAALPSSLYLLALSINHQVEETTFCYRPIIGYSFVLFFFLPSFT